MGIISGTDHWRDRGLAGRLIFRGAGFGLMGIIVIGIVGALVASWLCRSSALPGGGWMRDIVNATIGAVIVLVICR